MEVVLETPAAHPRSAPITTSAAAPLIGQVSGMAAREQAVEALLASYRSIPRGSTVRLSKRTSNLFRPRSAPRGQVWTSPR
jgi:exopolysaccharide biosynthesis protein